MAVETTDLTKSFGWDSTQSWTQHDIQELCRVMFDALEKEFHKTEQDNWINKYYEGDMADYVKCLECGAENTRTDKFLDIPLPLRSFASNEAYQSVEEALLAFVQPEILDGQNQYFCEKCNKKCKAHKGLKFLEFPYILTLHLKRFDFDYQTHRRVKLNDKVTFPQKLNVNAFINATNIKTSETLTDSSIKLEANCNHLGNQGKERPTMSKVGTMNNRDQTPIHQINGPYIYELFSIMIHSGSASGGHYYAYIKSFDTGEWFCFNDEKVSRITEDDIHRSFGGDVCRKPCSPGMYGSSTNAYMLMYRRVDPKRNEKVITIENFPEHIEKLRELMSINEQKKEKKRIETEILKPKVYFYNPQSKRMKSVKVYMTRNSTLENILDVAYGLLNIQEYAPITRCRLVAFDSKTEQIEMSFEGKGKDGIENIIKSLEFSKDFLLEIRKENEEFEEYRRGINCITLKAFGVDINKLIFDGPLLVYVQNMSELDMSNLKKLLSKYIKTDHDKMIFTLSPHNFKFVQSKLAVNKNSHYLYPKILFASLSDCSSNRETAIEILKKLADDFSYINYFYCVVPPTDQKSLEYLCIPSYEQKGNFVENNSVSKHLENNTYYYKINGIDTCQPAVTVNCTARNLEKQIEGKESILNEYDKSLNKSVPCSSDKNNINRNMTGFVTHNGQKLYIQATVVETDRREQYNLSTENCNYSLVANRNIHNYNKSCSDNNNESHKRNAKVLKIFLDKRMTIQELKMHLQSAICVPEKHFKISNYSSDDRCNFKDGEEIIIDLERQLNVDEIKAKIYYFKLSQLPQFSSKLLPVGQFVLSIKKSLADIKTELIAFIRKTNASDYQSLTVENCRIWRKWGRNPQSILYSKSCFAELKFCRLNCELVIQECETHASVEISDQTLTLFVRRWNPTKLELGKFDEITIDRKTNIKKALSNISNMSEEEIAYAVDPNYFPFADISMMDIRKYNWYTGSTSGANNILDKCENGNLCIYKNLGDTDVNLSEQEEKEIKAKEIKRIECTTGIASHLLLPKKERALKIYIDAPQNQ